MVYSWSYWRYVPLNVPYLVCSEIIDYYTMYCVQKMIMADLVFYSHYVLLYATHGNPPVQENTPVTLALVLSDPKNITPNVTDGHHHAAWAFNQEAQPAPPAEPPS